MSPFKTTETKGRYWLERDVSEQEILDFAKRILARKFRKGTKITSPMATKDYFAMRLADLEHEVFGVLFLDTQHYVLAYEELFRGTIDGASVYPREVVKHCLKHNASAVIFVHNHPSGVPEPSRDDQAITKRLRESLALVDVRVLDHLVIGGDDAVSFAERGLL